MTAQSISVLSELKVSSFGVYARAKTHSSLHQCRYINCTLSKGVPNVPQFLNFMKSLPVHALLDKTVPASAGVKAGMSPLLGGR